MAFSAAAAAGIRAAQRLRRARHASKVGERAARMNPPDQGFLGEILGGGEYNLKGPVLPHTAAGWALETGPDLLGAAAATAFAGPGAGAEDLVLGLGGSFVGRFAGAGLMQAIGRARGLSASQIRPMMEQGAGMGGLAGGLGFTFFGPRPLTDDARRKQEELYQQQMAQLEGSHMLMNVAASSPTVQNYEALLNVLAG